MTTYRLTIYFHERGRENPMSHLIQRITAIYVQAYLIGIFFQSHLDKFHGSYEERVIYIIEMLEVWGTWLAPSVEISLQDEVQ